MKNFYSKLYFSLIYKDRSVLKPGYGGEMAFFALSTWRACQLKEFGCQYDAATEPPYSVKLLIV